MLKIYNSQSRKKEEFKPVKDGKIGIYVCGPTVYNRIHIGNARTFISFDIIRRYLIWRGFDVTFVQNVTDVDDKIINKANEEGIEPSELAKKYTDLFIQDMHDANVLDPDIRPKATEEITPMIELVKVLIENGHAYVVDGDVYFDVSSFKGYGSLSGRDVEDAQSGHRELVADGQGLEDRKINEVDFALWKSAKPGEPSWDSPWGPGRPGWHIECSAMSYKFLGLPFDIHGGGSDLIFPHHENERAQSICAYNCGFANYWMHAGMLQVANDESGKNEKMSKSLNNFVLLHEAFEQVSADVLRMLVLQTHYRSPLVFGQKRIDEAASALNRLKTCISNAQWKLDNAVSSSEINSDDLDSQIEATQSGFVQAMDDDFNTSLALAKIFDLASALNQALADDDVSFTTAPVVQKAVDKIQELLKVFGLSLNRSNNLNSTNDDLCKLADKLNISYSNKDDVASAILEARAQARADKDWALADQIRDEVAQLGLTIEDTPQGSRIN